MIWIVEIVHEHEFSHVDSIHIHVSFSISYAECDVITNLFSCIESSLVYLYNQQKKKIFKTKDFIFLSLLLGHGIGFCWWVQWFWNVMEETGIRAVGKWALDRQEVDNSEY